MDSATLCPECFHISPTPRVLPLRLLRALGPALAGCRGLVEAEESVGPCWCVKKFPRTLPPTTSSEPGDDPQNPPCNSPPQWTQIGLIFSRHNLLAITEAYSTTDICRSGLAAAPNPGRSMEYVSPCLRTGRSGIRLHAATLKYFSGICTPCAGGHQQCLVVRLTRF